MSVRILISLTLLALPSSMACYAQGLRDEYDTVSQPIVQVAHQPEIVPSPAPLRQESPTFSLHDLEQLALEHNPTLTAADARIDAAQGRWVQAGLKPNPVIGYHATEAGNLGTAGSQGAFVRQQFITGKKLALDQAMASKEIERAQFQLYAQQQRVLSDVHLRFYDALVAQRRVELTGQLARIGDDLVRSAQKLLDARVGTENDLLQAQIRADESQLLHDTARNGHREAWQRLSAVIGLPNLQQSRLTGALDADLPIFDWDHCYAMVLGSNPQLGAAHARAERANIAIERARRENIPDVNVFLSMRHNNITSSDVANVEIGIPIPIRNRNQGNIRAAEAEWIASSQEVKRIELYLQDRLAVAYRRYANARERIDAYGQRIVPRAKRSLDLVREGYDRRQVEYLTLLTAQQTYYQVNLSYLDAMGELWAASSEIEGQLLTDSLSATD